MDKTINILKNISEFISATILDIYNGKTDGDETVGKLLEIEKLLGGAKKITDPVLLEKYCSSFETFSTYLSNLAYNIEIEELLGNLLAVNDSITQVIEEVSVGKKICPCCGKGVYYKKLPSVFVEMQKKYNTIPFTDETCNVDQYSCPYCGASDRDRMIISFLKRNNIEKVKEGTKLLQIAPAQIIERWVKLFAPQIDYESTDLYMDGVTFKSDIQNMDNISDGTYDLIICSHVLEHVQDDMRALAEMKRILKDDGVIIFLVPVDLSTNEIDEAWGLPEEENWRRFGQGDHVRRYGKNGLVERLEKEFYVNQLGLDYFGKEMFEKAGLADSSILYILTKQEKTDFDMEYVYTVNEELCNNGPLVSVLFPCYNHGKYVDEAMKSVINQSYKNLEIIVGDDGSTDNSADILKQYSKYYAKEYYPKENVGNIFWKLLGDATGKYIAIMNSDDYWEKDKIALQVEYLENHPECGACFTWAVNVDENMNNIVDEDSRLFRVKNKPSHEWIKEFWSNGNCLCHPSLVIRREYRMAPAKFYKNCWQLPDFFNWVELVMDTSIYVLPSEQVKMRRHSSEFVTNTSARSAENDLRTIMELGTHWVHIIRDMDEKLFKKAFRDIMIDPEADTEEEIKCEKYFLLNSHGSWFVKYSSHIYLTENYTQISDVMQNKYHYGVKEIKEDLTKNSPFS